MGGIVSSQRRARPASACTDDAGVKIRCDGTRVGALRRIDRPISAPPALVLAADRDVEVARRTHVLQHLHQRQGQAGRARDQSAAIPLDRKIGEAMVDQMLHEISGQEGNFKNLASDDVAALIKSVSGGSGPLAGALRLQASSKGLDLFESQPSPSTQRGLGESSPLRDISNMRGVSPKRRVLLDPVTADELEEADKMVADIMLEAGHLVNRLPEQMQQVLDDVKHGQSPVAEALREQVRLVACMCIFTTVQPINEGEDTDYSSRASSSQPLENPPNTNRFLVLKIKNRLDKICFIPSLDTKVLRTACY